MNLTTIETVALDPSKHGGSRAIFLARTWPRTRANGWKRLDRLSLEERIGNAPHAADQTEVPLLQRAKQGSREGEPEIPNNDCLARVLRLFFVSPGVLLVELPSWGKGGTSVTLMRAKFGTRTPFPLHLCFPRVLCRRPAWCECEERLVWGPQLHALHACLWALRCKLFNPKKRAHNF
jgi:hypothetical protein